jgi:Ni,Fe-hydrogenase III large subunit
MSDKTQSRAEKSGAPGDTGDSVLWIKSGTAVALDDVREVSIAVFRNACLKACRAGARLAALCTLPGEDEAILAVLADDAGGRQGLVRAPVPVSRSYPALTPELPQAQLFERELFEWRQIRPEGHPWLKAVRRHADLEAKFKKKIYGAPAMPHPFYRMEGDSVHEVAVGPVHAGVIEPGHFRFQCFGETVFHLEIQLGYQHRGAEAMLLRASPNRRLAVAESIAGDTAMGHSLAHCTALEALAGVEVPRTAQVLRSVALELERLSNHVGDLGALCNDVGYLPGASWFGRLRGEFLNLLMDISGNRFGRGLIIPGGVRFGVTPQQQPDFLSRLRVAERDLRSTAGPAFDAPSVIARFEHTGIVTRHIAEDIGLVGPAGRASGCDRDVRRDHPFAAFRNTPIPVAVETTGDVMARARMRWRETEHSIGFVTEQLERYADTALNVPMQPCKPRMLAVAMAEGWRGEIVHVAATDAEGQLAVYKIVDPSFHNWFGLAQSLRNNQISDFPLCNKSFNLSYAGYDL